MEANYDYYINIKTRPNPEWTSASVGSVWIGYNGAEAAWHAYSAIAEAVAGTPTEAYLIWWETGEVLADTTEEEA